MAILKITDEKGHERVYELSAAVTMAGRASANTIQINDEKSSRQHFKIELRNGAYFVEDLGSTNGTRVNGIKITAASQLRKGDCVSVGKSNYIFDEGPDADSSVNLEQMDITESPTVIPEIDGERPTLPPGPLDQSEFESEESIAAKKAGKPKFVLKVIEGASPGKTYEIGSEPVTLGRHASNTIQIDDEAASNYHSEFSREAIGFVVTDLGSTNGTRVKPKGRSEFEKVVKTPLSPGMQIRVGKTLLEFQNIGAPVPEEDHVFKTLELDTDKLNQKLATMQQHSATPTSGGMGMGAKIAVFAAIAAMVAAGVIFVPSLLKKTANVDPDKPDPKKDPVKVPKVAINLIPNAGFDQGSDEDGYPLEFQVSKAADVHIKVSTDASHSDGKDPQKRGLQISKSAKSQARQTVVETRDPIQIDANKTYEISGWARNDDDGIYGLRVTWLKGERDFSQNEVVLKESQEWKELKSPTLVPPTWATHARVGVFVQGKSGKACFDELSFKEKVGVTGQRTAPVRFNGIDLQFEGSKGLFSVSSQGKLVAEDCTLRLETSDGKIGADLASAMKPTASKNDAGSSFEGKLYDFSLGDSVGYSIGAQPGAVGVDLRAAFELPTDSASKPALRFYLTGPAATGDIDVAKGDKTNERLAATDDKSIPAVKGVLFNAGKTPQFNLIFAKPVELNLKREGKRRLVEIRFDGEVQVSMSPEDIEQKQKMQTAATEMRKALAAKDWGGAESKWKQFNEQFVESFPSAKEESTKAKEALDAAWKGTQDELTALVGAMQNSYTPELFEKAKLAAQRNTDAWKGSAEKSTVIGDSLAQINAIAEKYAAKDADKKAEENLKQAEGYMEKKIYNVAISFLKAKILDDPIASKTKAAERARELLPKAEAAQKELDDINAITDRLKAITKNLMLAKKYGEAIKAIESDPEFKANRSKLTEIQALLEDLKKK